VATMWKKVAIGAGVVAVLGGIGACGSSMGGMDMGGSSMSSMNSASATQSSTATTADFNQSDVTFAKDMYPHHAQAVEMAGFVEGRTTTTAVVGLASQIAKAQGPEMTTLKSLLSQWGQPTPADTSMSMSMPMDGMMSADSMNKLKTLSGAAFDREWLTMMIEHHTGAISMANTEIQSGKNAQAKGLAQSIVRAQQSEISTMKSLLAG